MDKKKKVTIIASISAAFVLVIGAIVGLVFLKGDKDDKNSSLPGPQIVDNNQRGTESVMGHNGAEGSEASGPHGATDEKFIGSWSNEDDGANLTISKAEDGTYTFVISKPEQIMNDSGQIIENPDKGCAGTLSADNSSMEFTTTDGDAYFTGVQKYKVTEKGYSYYMTIGDKTFRYNEQYSSAYRVPGLDESLEQGRIVPDGEVIDIDPNGGEVLPGVSSQDLDGIADVEIPVYSETEDDTEPENDTEAEEGDTSEE